MKKKENKQTDKILSILAVVLWMGLIFYLSSQVAEQSSRLSSGITQAILRAIGAFFPKARIDMVYMGFLVRKLAHFLCYLVLGILVLNVFSKFSVLGHKRFLFSAIVCVLYAVTDEIHQLFVPGRGCQIRDVLIDSFGAGAGFILFMIISKFILLKKQRKDGSLLNDNMDGKRNIS